MSSDLVIGGQLGNYMIESVMGRGGMSVVYRAVHSRLGTPVALKVLAPELSSDDAFRERFLREAKMAAGIDHPNVIPIYDTGLHGDSLYIVMRYVRGGDLKDMLHAAGALDVELAVAVLMPVARALDAAHADGLVHRDVKPANILLQRSASGQVEHVYLSDFGVTKHTTSVSGLTKTGALIGTIDYMAPEQIHGQSVSAQTDVYALACLFYQCVTGRVPHHRESEAAVLWAHMHEEIEPASQIKPGLPPALDEPIGRALAKDPAERYATCEDFIHAASEAARVSEPGRGDVPGLEALAGATAAGTVAGQPPAMPPPGGGPAAETVPSGDPTGAATSTSATPAAGAPAPTADGGNGAKDSRPWLARYWWVAAGLAGLVVVVIAVVALSSGGSSSSSADKDSFPAALDAVPTNHVTGTGKATVKLDGNVATVNVDTNGLLDAAPHAMHIHAGGDGMCPPSDAAHRHNGNLSISTVDGEPFYGPPVTALTKKGDVSTKSILAFARYPHEGNIRFTRKFTLPAGVADDVRKRKASVIVHGIDYNDNGLYDSVLERSELDRHLPGESTAPALCGALAPAGENASRGTLTFTATLDPRPSQAGWFCDLPSAPARSRETNAGA